MWKLITLLTSALEDTTIGGFLKERMATLGIIKDELNSLKSLYSWTDPRKILSYLKKENPVKLKNLLNQIQKRSTEQGKDLFKEQYKDSKEWVQLQSSWMKYGKFELTNKITNTGSATFLFQPSAKVYGPYVYPNMPADIWLALKNANANAGTLFWRIWLRVWLPSQIRKYVKQGLKDKGIYKGKVSSSLETARDIQDLRKYLRRLELGLYRNIGRDKRRSVKQIGTYKWKRNQAQEHVKKRNEFIQNMPGIKFVKSARENIKLTKQIRVQTGKMNKAIKFTRRVK